MLNITAVALSGLRRLVFCGPAGGSDGQEGVGPGRARATGTVCGEVRELAEVAGLLTAVEHQVVVVPGLVQPVFFQVSDQQCDGVPAGGT